MNIMNKKKWILSEYVNVWWERDEIWISTVGARSDLRTSDERFLSLLHAFSVPRTITHVRKALGPDITAFVPELIAAGVLRESGRKEEAALLGWDAITLSAHVRSRAALKSPSSRRKVTIKRSKGRPIQLRRGCASYPLDVPSVLSLRESIRTWKRRPLAFTTFSELCWLTFRQRDKDAEGRSASRSRPYPSATRYSIEIYIAVGRSAIEGVPSGLYRYSAAEHSLVPLSRSAGAYKPVLDAGGRAVQAETAAPIVFVMTCHYREHAKRYGPLAYNLILKEVGGLFQTLYIACTYLGLAPCALGAGTPEDSFSRAAGINLLAEPVVGEFVVGP